ncbi:hypothetical protein B0H13DRAFT_2266305 [Mycena leptocephala]|nr:hypothetical protein B0H13DRAFT_2266305 [Mycena leptocephala]
MHATKAETPGIRLGGVLGPRDELAFTILSTFIVTHEWIYPFFDPATPVVLVTDPATSGGDPEAAALKNVFPNWVGVCPPLTGGGGGRGCMHMKAARCTSSSAPHEWRDIENYVFIQDFLRAAPGVETVKLRPGEKPSEAFPAVLVALLGSTGQTRLLRAIQALGCSVDDWGSESKGKDKGKAGEWENLKSKGKSQENVEEHELELDYLTSSIGTYSVPWIAVFRLYACGRAQALRAYLDRGQKRIPAQGPTRVIHPTLVAIRGTVLDILRARTMGEDRCAVLIADPTTGLQMRDAKSRSGGVGVHTKNDNTKSEGKSDVDIVDAVVNYELGIVLRLERPEDVDAAVAWERPTRKYIEGDAPWIPQDSDFFK